jgi:hypothetical protein
MATRVRRLRQPFQNTQAFSWHVAGLPRRRLFSLRRRTSRDKEAVSKPPRLSLTRGLYLFPRTFSAREMHELLVRYAARILETASKPCPYKVIAKCCVVEKDCRGRASLSLPAPIIGRGIICIIRHFPGRSSPWTCTSTPTRWTTAQQPESTSMPSCRMSIGKR